MHKKVLKVLLTVILFYFPLKAMCWGQLGHRIVAEIADSYLTAKTKTAIKKILGDESIAIASNWPDFIKSDSTFKYLDPWHYINFEKNLTYDQMKDVLKKDTASVKDAYSAIVFFDKATEEKKPGS